MRSSHKKQSIDNKRITVPTDSIINPSTVIKIDGKGMQVTKKSTVNGDLYVRFEISFPSFLENEKKEVLRKILSDK